MTEIKGEMMAKLWAWIVKFFSSPIGLFIKEVFKAEVLKVVELIKDVAIIAVTELASSDLSSDDKRKAAFLKIKEYAIKEGIEVKDSMINLAIEMAVAKMKG